MPGDERQVMTPDEREASRQRLEDAARRFEAADARMVWREQLVREARTSSDRARRRYELIKRWLQR